MANERVLLLYNQPILPADHPEAGSEADILETVEVIHGILKAGGFDVRRFGVGLEMQPLLDCLRKDRPDVVFNLFEGLADRPFTESVVAGILEWHEISFTGSPSEALTLARNKEWAKFMMLGADLPTPPFFTVERLPAPKCHLQWPVIVKPAAQDASVGIDQASVVMDQSQLEARIAYVLDRFGKAIVEQYIAGREIQVSVVDIAQGPSGSRELRALPFAEVVFTDPKIWPIYSYDAKWMPSSKEHESSPLQIGVNVPADWSERIIAAAAGAFRLLGCRDYARVDMRVSVHGEPFILEVNANPYLIGFELIDGLPAIGKSHPEFICDLIRAALGRRNPSTIAPKSRTCEPKPLPVLTGGRRARPARARARDKKAETA